MGSPSPAGRKALRTSIRSGLRTGLVLATLFSLVVTVQRVFMGAAAFARLGMRWEEVIALYYVAFSLGASGYGALLPLRRARGFDLPAMMSGVLFVAPMYLGAAVLMSRLFPSLRVAVTGGIVAALFVGVPLGLFWWDTDRERATQQQPADNSGK
jgi:hypothetical protein